MAEKIYEQEIIEEVKQSFLDYSMSVIVDRSLPDIRSGLKPIHTKILYAAYELGLKSDKAFKKSAKLVGHVIGSYSPHGDEATYQAIVKLVQNFYLRYPLMLGEGAWGSQDGDEAAAYRYTLCKLSKYGELMLDGIKDKAVDFKPTFSNEGEEPVVLPSLFPALLCNGSTGIATGVAQKFAPHNLKEICDGIIAFLNNENITIAELMNYIKGPDFPTGCKVINQSELLNFYETGRGSIKIQGVYHFEKKGKYSEIIFTEIPFGVSKEKVIEKVATLCSKNELNNITDIHDDSTFKNGVKLVIQTSLKEDEDLQKLINLILEKTDLETSFSINQNAIVNGNPKLVNLKDMIIAYCEHQKNVLLNVSNNEKDKLLIQLEKLNGLLIAIAHIDEVIQLIKNANNKNEAKQKLMNIYTLSDLEADTILNMKLSRLTKIDGIEIKNKQQEIAKRLKELENIINNPITLKEELIKKIEKMKQEYGDNRRTEITNLVRKKNNSKKEILVEDTTVLITTKGDIKRVNNYKKTGTSLIATVATNTNSTLCIFTNVGICHKISVKKIPLVLKNGEKGISIQDFGIINEEILFVVDSAQLHNNILALTKKGYNKCIAKEEFLSNRNTKFISLKENDEVIYCSEYSKKGLKIKTNKRELKITDVVVMKRNAFGNKDKTWQEDEIIEKIL